jgi:hypothetical protein
METSCEWWQWTHNIHLTLTLCLKEESEPTVMKKKVDKSYTTSTNWSTQVNLAYIDHSLKLSTYELLLLSIMTFISKAHLKDHISLNLFSWTYHCLLWF